MRFTSPLAAAFFALACMTPVLEEEQTGETKFNNACRTCHSVKKDDNRPGPSLHGIVGRKAGSAEGFAYSSSAKEANTTWDEQTLDKVITAPEAVVPNNGMKPFTGIGDAETRKSIIEFLKTAPAG